MAQSPSKRAELPAADLKALPEAALAGLACDYAAGGDIAGFRALAAAVQGSGADLNAGTPYDRRTPLHLAAAAGNLDMARFLIEECGAKLQRDRFGLLPIHDAVENGHAEVRRYLQNKKITQAAVKPAGARPRSNSMDGASELHIKNEQLEEMMSVVFELVAKEGVFSYTTVHAEVQYFFRNLGLHPVYFEHFTPLQIAKHIHCLIAAKRVARATDNKQMQFGFKSETSGFFLTTLASPEPTEAQRRTEEKVAAYLSESQSGKLKAISLIFMGSEYSAFAGGEERLGIFAAERGLFDAIRVSPNETSLEVLASARFLKTKTQAAKEQYQMIMEDVVASRGSVVRSVPGSVYPGPFKGGFVLLFGTAETAGRHYLAEICQAVRFVGVTPRRFYLETFANGVITYSIFFPAANQEEMKKLERAVMYSTHLKAFPGRSEVIYNNVMQAKISHEVGLYLQAAVQFAYTFFPKERYAHQYVDVHKHLANDPSSQAKLEALYKLCMKELLSIERIYELVQRHLHLAPSLFEDFRAVALGQANPGRADLGSAIDTACTDDQDRQILRMLLTFNEAIRMTNFFKEQAPGAFAFRLDPAVVLKDRPSSMYPEIPYGIYMVCGRDFLGFHTRFRDVARGGIRLVLSRDRSAYERNYATIFDECYNLALTQQQKNKDIPEGGAKGVILPDIATAGEGNVVCGASSMSPAASESSFTRYLNALLDCMLPEQSGVYEGHMKGKKEILFFGPDENTANFMDLGAGLAQERGYPFWKALTTGKGVTLGGVPHDTYGMTTASVHQYVIELLRELGEDEEKITKFQTGGPDGDLGSNEILVSKDRTIGIVDGSGVLYDPAGLDRAELTRLAKRRVPVKEFSRAFLGKGGFLVLVEETNVKLPDGSVWRTGAQLRDEFHLTDFAAADLFVPCGGRPNAVTTENVKRLFAKGGEKPKFRMIVEGANLFFSPAARKVMESAGVHVFRDASTNKGGVTSSSLEVFAALALSPSDHTELMTYKPVAGEEPPEFYSTYVNEILDIIVENAKLEFHAIWKCNRNDGVAKAEATRRLSTQVNQMTDSINEHFATMSQQERETLVTNVLSKALPPEILKRIGVAGVLARVPQNYIQSIVSSWTASRYVYRYGINASEVSFFLFMRELLGDRAQNDGGHKRAALDDANTSPAKR